MARTPKAKALGAALRQAREKKGMLLRELSAVIQRDTGSLSRWETGERTPQPEQVAQILSTLGVNGERYDEIMTLAYRTNESQWVGTTLPEQRQQMLAYLDWEQNAKTMVQVDPLLVPGLLQTAEYVRAIMTAAGAPAGEIASRVTSRVGRREVVTRQNNPAKCLVLLGEAALNRGIGGRKTMLGQLRFLLEMSGRPNIELRIFPDNRDWHPGLEGPFALIEAHRGQASTQSIVFVHNRRTVLMLHEDDDIAAYKRAIDRIMNACLPPDLSARLLADTINQKEKPGGARAHLAQIAP